MTILKDHDWFFGINWDQINERLITPPFVPQLKDLEDTSYF